MKKRVFILAIFLLSHSVHARASDKYFCITNKTQIYDQPDELVTPINSAKPGETFVYLGTVSSKAIPMSYKSFVTVILNNKTVYILSDAGQVIVDPEGCSAVNARIGEINKRGKEIMEEQEKKRAAEEEQRSAKAALAEHKRQQTIKATGKAKGWSTDCIASIIDRKVYVGMTSEMVLLSWGRPERRNKTITAGGTQEQWVYSLHEYIYLRDGIVTGIQTSN